MFWPDTGRRGFSVAQCKPQNISSCLVDLCQPMRLHTPVDCPDWMESTWKPTTFFIIFKICFLLLLYEHDSLTDPVKSNCSTNTFVID